MPTFAHKNNNPIKVKIQYNEYRETKGCSKSTQTNNRWANATSTFRDKQSRCKRQHQHATCHAPQQGKHKARKETEPEALLEAERERERGREGERERGRDKDRPRGGTTPLDNDGVRYVNNNAKSRSSSRRNAQQEKHCCHHFEQPDVLQLH
jgi:hypothetical protein